MIVCRVDKGIFLCLSLFLFFLFSTPTLAVFPTTPQTNTWITDGLVNSIVTDDTTVYIGGEFNRVMPFTGLGVQLNLSDLSNDNTMPIVNGGSIINASASDGAGGWYIGGYFNKVGDVGVSNFAHILANGSVDPNINFTFSSDRPSTNINTITVDGSIVYIGGNFNNVGGQSRQYIASIDTSTQPASVTDFSHTFTNYKVVNNIQIKDNNVFVGGSFDSVDGAGTKNGVVKFDKTTGTLTNWIPATPISNTTALTLSNDGSIIYQAGYYWSSIIVAINTSTGSTLFTTPTNGSSINKTVINSSTGNLLIAGDFTTVNGSPQQSLAYINPSTGTLIPWTSSIDGEVNTTVFNNDASILYVGGKFLEINNRGDYWYFFAAINTATGEIISKAPYFNNQVYSLTISGTKIYAGGEFTGAGGSERHNVAAITASTGLPTAWAPDIYYDETIYNNGNTTINQGEVFSLAFSPDKTKLYIGGHFTKVNNVVRNFIAEYNLTTNTLTDWAPFINTNVKAIATVDSKVFLGGDFFEINNIPHKYLAAFDMTNNGEIISSFNPNPHGSVLSLLVSPDKDYLYVGAPIEKFKDGDPNYYYYTGFGRILLSDGTFDETFNDYDTDDSDGNDYEMYGEVNTIVSDETNIYIGGNFGYTYNGDYRNYAASFSLADGSLRDWIPIIEGYNINAMLIDGSDLYIAGYIYCYGINCYTPNIYNLAAVDLETGNTVTWYPGSQYDDNDVRALAKIDNTLYVGSNTQFFGDNLTGYFTQFGSNPNLTDPEPDPDPTPTETEPSPEVTVTPTPTLTVTPTPSTNNNSGSSNTSASPTAHSDYVCRDLAPFSAPDLFQIDTTSTTATLHFVPSSLPYDRYFIAYGPVNNPLAHAVEYRQGYSPWALNFQINHLKPNTKYIFQIKAGNGCSMGPLGNTMTAYTGVAKTKVNKFFKFDNKVVKITSAATKTITTSPKINNTPTTGSKPVDPVVTNVPVKKTQTGPGPIQLIDKQGPNQPKTGVLQQIQYFFSGLFK